MKTNNFSLFSLLNWRGANNIYVTHIPYDHTKHISSVTNNFMLKLRTVHQTLIDFPVKILNILVNLFSYIYSEKNFHLS